MDGDDEPDGAAGRIGSRGAAQPRVPAQDPRWGKHYRITGQKIFITYGDHDLAPNIVHMVLARTPEAPPQPGNLAVHRPQVPARCRGATRIAQRCPHLEPGHKLGIHASPTCVLAYGEDDGAIGWRIGEENRGLEYMFTMMNAARLQCRVAGCSPRRARLSTGPRLRPNRCRAGRSRCCECRGAADHSPSRCPADAVVDAQHDRGDARARLLRRRDDRSRSAPPEPAARQAAQRRADLLIPVVKAWCHRSRSRRRLDRHPGAWRHGYVEETGAAQHLRDARIAPSMRGPTASKRNDLVGRKARA